MQDRVRFAYWCVGVGLSLGLSSSCKPTERDLASLLGASEAGAEDEAGPPVKDPGDASTDAGKPDLDATAPVPAVEASTPPPKDDGGKTETETETDEPEPPDAAATTEPPSPDASVSVDSGPPDPPSKDAGADGGDAGNCSAASLELDCNNDADDDCDGRTDCEDQDCSEEPKCCVASGEVEAICDNAHDEDCDGKKDCDDEDCAIDLSCQICEPVAETELDCSDGADDDCDMLSDCNDAEDCASDPECLPPCVPVGESELLCEGGEDDDCDGFPDCEDSDCAAALECQTACVPSTEDCSDGEDNDCDGFEDCLDSACAPTAGCCVESGEELCDDGVDNDCDGVIDCPLIVATVPYRPPPGREDWEGGAVAASDARLTLQTPALDNYLVQCRSGKPNAINSELFVVCNPADPTALTVQPFADTEATNPEHDGLVTTQVRFAYENGQVSKPASFTYYVHSSLAGAQLCPPKAEDDQYFAAAQAVLVNIDSPRFRDDDAKLMAPFVNIDFSPREQPEPTFDVPADSGKVEYLSLRRRFSLDPDKSMVLMKRLYMSRRAGNRGCLTAMIRKHQNDLGPLGTDDMSRYVRSGCDAVVLNKHGAGVCLVVDGSGGIVIANPQSDRWTYWNFDIFGWVDWAKADNFMWRKLLSHQQNGQLRVFSPKCYDVGGTLNCATVDDDTLLLPDRDQFSW